MLWIKRSVFKIPTTTKVSYTLKLFISTIPLGIFEIFDYKNILYTKLTSSFKIMRAIVKIGDYCTGFT